MSDDRQPLGDLVDPGIHAYAAQSGGMVTGSLTVITLIDADGDQQYAIATAPGQTFTTTLGVLAIADLTLKKQIKESL